MGCSPLSGGPSTTMLSTRSRAPRAEEPLFGCSSVRHWHLAAVPEVSSWLPRRQRACPSAALDERVLDGDNSGGVPYAATRYGPRRRPPRRSQAPPAWPAL